MSIIKAGAYWFHVREARRIWRNFWNAHFHRRLFCIRLGQISIIGHDEGDGNGARLCDEIFVSRHGTPTDATWAIFYIPAFILVFWTLIDCVIDQGHPIMLVFHLRLPVMASSGPDAYRILQMDRLGKGA